MEVTCSSETSVHIRTTWRCTAEFGNILNLYLEQFGLIHCVWYGEGV
jgi:hypothetical protein